MKKTFLSLLLALLVIPAFAQDNKAFLKEIDSIYKKSMSLISAKDYATGVDKMIGIFDKINSRPEAELKSNNNYNWTKSKVYYDIACAYSLWGNKKAALNALSNAVDYGWDNYNHLRKDTDLNSLRNEDVYIAIEKKLRETKDYQYLLSKAAKYERSKSSDTLPKFSYLDKNDPRLVNLRKTLNLDSIAGTGDEISQMKNLLLFIHNTMRHDGNSSNPKKKNTLDLIDICKKEDRGVNCRMLGTALSECYMAMGFPARFMTCLPKDQNDFDCHVITMVWSKTLNKWLWMDPTQNAYLADENGVLLGFEEVRERIINKKPIVLNEDANWNNRQKAVKENYVDEYMAKNLYWFECPLDSSYDTETVRFSTINISLYPKGWDGWEKRKGVKTDDKITHDSSYFWAAPNVK